MKNYIIILAALLVTSIVSSQSIEIKAIYNQNSQNCIPENYRIELLGSAYKRTDLYDNSFVWSPSRVENTGYNEQDLFYEIWSPRFYLNQVGVDEYQKVYHYLIKIIYKSKGGTVLYIIEEDLDNTSAQSKYFITEEGTKYFCEN